MSQIKKLRAMTNAGILDCKKALDESNNDIDVAVDILRKKGLSKATKKGNREASDGVVSLSFDISMKSYAMVELNCETDFVARNSAFKNAASVLSDHALSIGAKSSSDLLKSDMDGEDVEKHIQSLISTFGENTVVGRAISETTEGFFEGYIHSNDKLAVVVEAEELDNRDILRDIAMHIAAMSPLFLDKDAVDEETLKKEREIYREELLSSGKPEAVIDRIVEGKISKYYENSCLMKQKFVKDSSVTVEEYVKGKVKILSFKRYQLGER